MSLVEVTKQIAKQLELYGANDIKVFDLSEKDTYTKFIVFSTSPNIETTKDVCIALESYMIENYNTKAYSKEGFHKGLWVINDYTNIVVHVMLKQEREKYKIDTLYKNYKKLSF